MDAADKYNESSGLRKKNFIYLHKTKSQKTQF